MADLGYYKKLINAMNKFVKGQPTFEQLNEYRTVVMAMLTDFDAQLEDGKLNKETYFKNRDYTFQISSWIKNWSNSIFTKTKQKEYSDLFWDVLLWESHYLFESYLIFMERNRKPNKRFYLPRRKTLYVVVQDLQDLEDGKIEFLGVSLPPRTGKLISDDTPVLTDVGWKNHGDLKVGDYVYDYDGLPVMVTHVFPKNYANKRVWFTDGSYIDCHENHEWVIFDKHKGRERIAETKDLVNTEIIDKKSGKKRYCYQIPLYQPLVGDIKELPVQPYTLGAWLGDGRNQNPDICGAKEDYAIVQSIIDDGYDVSWHTTHKDTKVEYYGFKGLRQDLQKLGMCHSRKRVEKHIPDIYMCASIPQRLELLAGLIDTDGCLSKKEHRYSFSTTEELLKEDFVSLVSTFGWRCCVTEEQPHETSSGIHGRKVVYIISFNPTYPIPCRLKRKQLFEFSKRRRVAIKKIEDIEPKQGNCISVQGGLYRVGRRCIPTHNSTLCIFFMSWVMGKRPWSHNAMSGHSGILAKPFFKEALKLIESDEYEFKKIFPNVASALNAKGEVIDKSSDELTINLDKSDRFATLTCRGIDGTWTGAVDISSDGYLYVDDMVRDRSESLSQSRLEGRYQDYLNVLVDRKNDGSKELMVGTRWNVLDPLGRVEAENKDNPKYRFRRIPALNEKDQSNFKYDYGLGFSTEHYRKMRNRLDKNEWEAKFQQNPFVREGLILPEDELRTYNGILPEGDYKVLSACDVAWGGGDSLSMPVGYEYENGDVYIPKWIFNGGKKEVTLPLVVGTIIGEGIREITFEANNGGDMYCKYVDEKLEEEKYMCSCSSRTASSKIAKTSKMIAASGYVIKHFIFLDREHQSQEYKNAFDEMVMTTGDGSNTHDDACDGITQLAMKIENPTIRRKSIIRESPI